jgi:hypothetical protein
MTSTDPSITYLLGAGMVHDVLAWVFVVACMLVSSFALGILLGVWRKRRIAKNARRAEIALKNYEHWVEQRRQQRISFAYGNIAMHNPRLTRAMVEAEDAKLHPPAPACGVAQSCNGCSDCPDIHRPPIATLDV